MGIAWAFALAATSWAATQRACSRSHVSALRSGVVAFACVSRTQRRGDQGKLHLVLCVSRDALFSLSFCKFFRENQPLQRPKLEGVSGQVTMAATGCKHVRATTHSFGWPCPGSFGGFVVFPKSAFTPPTYVSAAGCLRASAISGCAKKLYGRGWKPSKYSGGGEGAAAAGAAAGGGRGERAQASRA